MEKALSKESEVAPLHRDRVMSGFYYPVPSSSVFLRLSTLLYIILIRKKDFKNLLSAG